MRTEPLLSIKHKLVNNILAQSTFLLSPGLTNDSADHAAILNKVNTTTPTLSLILLKNSGDMGTTHVGGTTIWPVGSANYNTIRDWIAGQAPFN